MKAREQGIPMSSNTSTRLNAIDSPYSRSIGNTPNTYQMSSLNPSALARSATQSKEHLLPDKFQELEVIKVVKQFEQKLSEVSSKVSSFTSEDLDTTVQSMLDIDRSLTSQINQLEEHQRLGTVINGLEAESKVLDDTAKDILKQLIGFRAELKQLPSLPTKHTTSEDDIKELDVDEVLKYGMKLAKFTKVPPTAAPTHPNNFVWPAEDSLRRGMLALSSLKEEEVLQNEIGMGLNKEKEQEKAGQSPIEEAQVAPEPEAEPEAEPEHIPQPPEQPKRESRKAEEKKELTTSLNLDLFDPEDEDSD